MRYGKPVRGEEGVSLYKDGHSFMSYPGQITMTIWIYIITKFTMWMKSKPSYVNRPRPWDQTYATRIYTILQEYIQFIQMYNIYTPMSYVNRPQRRKNWYQNPAMWIDLGIDTSECKRINIYKIYDLIPLVLPRTKCNLKKPLIKSRRNSPFLKLNQVFLHRLKKTILK